MELPIILGAEIAGTVETAGKDAKKSQKGMPVYGKIASGGYAEYAIAKGNELKKNPKTPILKAQRPFQGKP